MPRRNAPQHSAIHCCRIPPIKIAFSWIMYAFAGYLEVDQVATYLTEIAMLLFAIDTYLRNSNITFCNRYILTK